MTSHPHSPAISLLRRHNDRHPKPRTIAIIQARMGSTRLPGKVLHQLCGRTVLEHVLNRVRTARLLDGLFVATTQADVDDAIVDECKRIAITSFRGSEDDVLDRYYQAAKQFEAEVVVRVTADCPLFDGTILDEMLDIFEDARCAGNTVDYLSNVQRRTFPQGLDAEVFTLDALARAHAGATQPYEREHVTPYLYEHAEQFRLHSFEGLKDLSHYRWTLDTPDDLEFMQAVYSALYRAGEIFSTGEVLALLESHPEMAALNAHIRQKELVKQ